MMKRPRIGTSVALLLLASASVAPLSSIAGAAGPNGGAVETGALLPGLEPRASRRTPASANAPASGHGEQASEVRAVGAYGKLPMAFEPNVGQADSEVRYLARGRGYTVFATDTEAVLTLSGGHPGGPAEGPEAGGGRREKAEREREPQRDTLRLRWVGGRAGARPVAVDGLQSTSNYFVGSDPSKWRAGVANYARVRYEGVYRGVDVDLYGTQHQLEYDFRVAPGANARQVRVKFEGAESVAVDEQGGLALRMKGGAVRQAQAYVYQEGASGKQQVAVRYVLGPDGEVGFALGAYDTQREVVIDPILEYALYLGGSMAYDAGGAIAVDVTGAAYITGSTPATDYPTTVGAYDTSSNGYSDLFVTKVSADGASLLYSTFLGGSENDFEQGIAVDGGGAAYVTGYTRSADYPTTAGAYDTSHGGNADVLVTKLSSDGASLLYSTFLGGSESDFGYGIAVDGAGAAYVTGYTHSANFPTANAAQATVGVPPDVFVTKVSADGASLLYSTFLGASSDDIGQDIAVDGAGAAYIIGYSKSANFPTTVGAYDTSYNFSNDVFVTKLSADGASLIFSTFLGGAGNDTGYGIAVDGSGAAHVTGFTYVDVGAGYPTTAGAFDPSYNGEADVFVTKLSADGASLLFSTFLGGSRSDDFGYGIAVDGAGAAYVTGSTNRAGYPTTADAVDPSYNGGVDAFVTKLSVDGASLLYSTFLGGSSDDYGQGIAVDGAGAAYVTGRTTSVDFATTGFGTPDGASAFVAKIPAAASAGGADTVGVFMQDHSAFFLRNTLASGPADLAVGYGPEGAAWIPLRGDWDGDGDDTIGLYDPVASAFFLKNTNAAGGADLAFGFGPVGVGWVPLAGDWNGDGVDTVGVFDPATSTFFLRDSNTSGPAHYAYGYGPSGAGWTPIVGDWDGDNRDTVGLYAPESSAFFLRNTHGSGEADLFYGFGPAGAGWTALAGDWDGDGVDTVGLYAASSQTFFLREAHDGGEADHVVGYGPPGAMPLVGDWDGE